MKIIFLTEYLNPQINGIAIRIENHIKYLRELGNIVEVYGPINCSSSTIKFSTIQLKIINANNLYIGIGLKIFFHILKNNYDIIHIIYPLSLYGNLVLFAAKIKNIKVICSFHVNLIEYNKLYPIKYILYNFVKYIIYYPTLNNILLAPNKINDITTIFNLKTKILPTGVDTKLFSYSKISRKNIIVYVGRLSIEKNLFKLIDLFKLINNKYILKIIGNGPIKNDLIKYININNIKNIFFINEVPQYKLIKYYQEAKFFFTCSITETYGFTCLEALSCGTPILYPRCKVFNNLYNKYFYEMSFDLNNDISFIKSVKYIETNNLNSKCRKYAEKYSWKNATIKLLHIYKNAIKK